MKECQTIAEVRENIDRIDAAIAALICERCGYVRQAAKLKQSKAEVTDEARIEEVIAKVRDRALDFDADLLERIYRQLIACFIDFEAKEFDRLGGGAEA